MTPKVRQLTKADLERVVAISSKAHFGKPWTSAKLETEIQEAESLALVDSGSAELVAFVFYRRLQGSVLEISWLATDPNRHRQGHMSTLYEALLDAESQLSEIWLEVHENNREARNLYEKWGFAVTSKRSRYYADGGAALLMSRKFT